MRAIYPGSFDPFTNGHLDIVERALNVVDELVVAVLKNTTKKSLLELDQRIELISEVLKKYGDRVQVESFSGLLVDYCRSKNTTVVIRGLRAVSDFDFEHAIFLMNKKMYADFETLFFMSSSENSFISSTIVKEVASLGGNVADQVPPAINRKLSEIFKKP
ncbi:MAG: pantetheine-phosphate adenylyltransferase [Spirochaetia bacterium]|nr:pantetheine-phosphate adenylyltransferase [Spirochaetia bacterium]